jgi:ubiquinone/menaquinone biosynthesis C-methylase UbiE
VNGVRWDHNAFYHRWLLARLPPRCDRVLDVGCGAGLFTAKLAARAGRVDAVDRSTEMIELARTRVPPTVRCIEADLLEASLPAAGYDAVTCISALHHMPLDAALGEMARVLRPGGVLAAVGLYRRAIPADLPFDALAVLAHQFLGVALVAGRRIRPGRAFLAPQRTELVMPVMEPRMTLKQIRAIAEAVLPGARVRRRLFWRHSLLWRRPLDPAV